MKIRLQVNIETISNRVSGDKQFMCETTKHRTKPDK